MYTYLPSLLEWHLHSCIFSQSNELSYGFYILSFFSCHVATKQQDSFFFHTNIHLLTYTSVCYLL